MLGFSPLAAAPLADDGAIAEVVYLLNGDDITTGQPTVGSSSIAQDHDLALLTAMTTGSAYVVPLSIAQDHDLAAMV